MDEILGPPEWVLLEEEARAGTEDAWVELTSDDILEHLQLAERHRANAEAARLALLARYRELRAREGELAERSRRMRSPSRCASPTPTRRTRSG